LGTLFDRTTCEYHSLSDLPGEVLAALRADVEKFELPEVGANVIGCFQTTSVPTKKHKKDKESEIQHLSIVLTPEMLYWVLDWRGNSLSDLPGEVLAALRADVEKFELPEVGANVIALGEAVKKAGGVWKQ